MTEEPKRQSLSKGQNGYITDVFTYSTLNIGYYVQYVKLVLCDRISNEIRP